MSEEQPKKLNRAQEVFVSEYLSCFNATAAYLVAYPKGKRDSARANASRLIAEDNVKQVIQDRMKEIHMSADEALKRMADIARGDIGDLVNAFGAIDLAEAKRKGLTHLIKKVKQRTVTKMGKKDEDDVEIHDLEVETYSAKDALETILKVGGRLKDVEININVKLTDD